MTGMLWAAAFMVGVPLAIGIGVLVLVLRRRHASDDRVAPVDASVLCPTICIATERGTPARSRLRTAVRRKSWKIRPGTPAAAHADSHARRNDLIGAPLR